MELKNILIKRGFIVQIILFQKEDGADKKTKQKVSFMIQTII